MSTPTTTNMESVKWTKVEVDAFVAAMVEEVKKGNKTTSTFNKTGWNGIRSKLETQFGRSFSNLQLCNKMNKLRTDYESFKKLLETSGFNWNGDIRACEVTDECVWDRHIKVGNNCILMEQKNPTWLKFKRNGLPQWPELQIIFGDSYALGSRAVSNAEEHNIFEDLYDLEAEQAADLTSPGLGNSDNKRVNDRNETHQLDKTPSGRRKKGRHTELVGAIKEMCNVSRARLELLSGSQSSVTNNYGGKDYSVNCCIFILDSMVELDKNLYTKAIMKAIENPTWREAFVSVPADRKMWLLEKL